jgi:hypothetical protein
MNIRKFLLPLFAIAASACTFESSGERGRHLLLFLWRRSQGHHQRLRLGIASCQDPK